MKLEILLSHTYAYMFEKLKVSDSKVSTCFCKRNW